jgi:hypothetical protein
MSMGAAATLDGTRVLGDLEQQGPNRAARERAEPCIPPIPEDFIVLCSLYASHVAVGAPVSRNDGHFRVR